MRRLLKSTLLVAISALVTCLLCNLEVHLGWSQTPVIAKPLSPLGETIVPLGYSYEFRFDLKPSILWELPVDLFGDDQKETK